MITHNNFYNDNEKKMSFHILLYVIHIYYIIRRWAYILQDFITLNCHVLLNVILMIDRNKF